MFGREVRLPVDVEYNLKPTATQLQTYSEYIRKLEQRVDYAYELAAKQSKLA